MIPECLGCVVGRASAGERARQGRPAGRVCAAMGATPIGRAGYVVGASVSTACGRGRNRDRRALPYGIGADR